MPQKREPARPVVRIKGTVDAELLSAWLTDVAGAVEVEVRGLVTTVRGLDLDLDLDLDPSTASHVEPTWWAASVLRRALRTVVDAGDCGSPGLENVLAGGTWAHPRARRGPADVAGIMLVKPGMRAGPSALREIGRRLAECGYRAERARAVSAEEIGRENLAVQHHGAHAELAISGRMSPLERIAYLTIYDKPSFVERFGVTAAEVDVFPAQVVLEKMGVPAETLTRWSVRDTARHNLDSGEVDGPNGIGDCLFVNVFQDPGHHGGQPFAVLNPHLPGVLAEFTAGNGAIAIQISTASDHALPWWRMRREFCGVTDPREALPGSVRGDALAGLLDLSGVDGRPVRRINNGVHLSNGAVEALRDGWTWLRQAPDDTVAGHLLAAAGVSPWSAVTKPFVVIGRARRVAQEITDGLDAEGVAPLLSGVTMLEHADDWDDSDAVELVDAVWAATTSVRQDRATRAIALVRDAGVLVIVSDDENTNTEFGSTPSWERVVRCSAAEVLSTLVSLSGDHGATVDSVLPLWDPEQVVATAVRTASA
ncbi:hypothetical protein [Umezawaea tangerina]|uniref:Uncharacterized protein n=1 Tax=Umezawaea tangerina TaxID=84725 RepID=A0A2T0T491_9PSEU|nr:hypothetical protein [Umezawaea tangerina]PRY40482.1 hypothetical protein CLV43_106218 [Umezawaea tangerina]